MIGELREATLPAADTGGPRCPACGHRQASGDSCEVCGQRFGRRPTAADARAAGVTSNSDRTAADPPTVAGLMVGQPELSENIVTFARKAWTDSLHPRGLGGKFRDTPDAPRGPVHRPVSRTRSGAPVRSPHAEHAPQKTRAKAPSKLTRGEPKSRPVTKSAEGRKLSEEELPKAVGHGQWSASVADTVSKMRAGTVTDSEQHFRKNGGPYPPERVALHARIVNLMLQGAGAHAEPKAIFMAGGGGSGKTSVIKQGDVKLPADAVDINSDIIKTMLPEFQALVAVKDPRAAALVHEESSHIAKLLTNLVVMRRHHAVVDGTGNAGGDKFRGKITAMQGAGYAVELNYVNVPTDVAFDRAEKRGKKSGRIVPEGALRATHQSVSAVWVNSVSKDNSFPVRIFDNSSKAKAVLIAERPKGGELSVKRPQLYQEFIDKADAAKERQKSQLAQAARRQRQQDEAVAALRKQTSDLAVSALPERSVRW